MRHVLSVLALVLLVAVAPASQEQQHVLTVTARRYAFTPDRIEVNRGDVVRITVETEDIPHSFTIDSLRICRKADPGKPAVLEFRADEPGTYAFYCNLSADPGCRAMRGVLIVH